MQEPYDFCYYLFIIYFKIIKCDPFIGMNMYKTDFMSLKLLFIQYVRYMSYFVQTHIKNTNKNEP